MIFFFFGPQVPQNKKKIRRESRTWIFFLLFQETNIPLPPLSFLTPITITTATGPDRTNIVFGDSCCKKHGNPINTLKTQIDSHTSRHPLVCLWLCSAGSQARVHQLSPYCCLMFKISYTNHVWLWKPGRSFFLHSCYKISKVWRPLGESSVFTPLIDHFLPLGEYCITLSSSSSLQFEYHWNK